LTIVDVQVRGRPAREAAFHPVFLDDAYDGGVYGPIPGNQGLRNGNFFGLILVYVVFVHQDVVQHHVVLSRGGEIEVLRPGGFQKSRGFVEHLFSYR
jgi:hypothetical protein